MSLPEGFRLEGPYAKNAAPYGVTLWTSQDYYLHDITHEVRRIKGDESYPEDIVFHKSVRICQPDERKEGYYLDDYKQTWNHPRFSSYEAAINAGIAALLATRP